MSAEPTADTGELAPRAVPVLEDGQQEEGRMTKSLLLLSAAALLLPACQAAEKSGNTVAEGNAAVDAGADEQAIRGKVDRWLQLVKAKDAAGIASLYAEDGAVFMTASRTIFQERADPATRGRVLSVYSLATMVSGGVLGSMVAGLLVTHLGPLRACLFSAIAMSAIVSLSARLTRIPSLE